MKRTKGSYQTQAGLRRAIATARGLEPCDLVFKNGQFVDVFQGHFVKGDVAVTDGVIVGIGESYTGHQEVDLKGATLAPGFIDAHVHIESSLVTPASFQEAVLPLGTTTVIWDPHEIANVWGVRGIEWALSASDGLSLDVFVMVPSCVPSTSPAFGFETSGADLRAKDIQAFKDHPRVLGLAEMMNFPGLLNGDDDVIAKLFSFQSLYRDGHCPMLSGRDLNAYGAAGIHSCHESTRLEEAAEKLMKGIQVLVREGSCAKDADKLLPLIGAMSSAVIGLASDDRNPLDIAEEGHINAIIDKGLKMGLEPSHLFRVASFAPARMFGLADRGAIAPGYQADLVIVRPRHGEDWRSGLRVQETFKRGRRVDAASLREASVQRPEPKRSKNIHLERVSAADFQLAATRQGSVKARVIGVIPRQILTEALAVSVPVVDGYLDPSDADDLLRIAVLERHARGGTRSVALVRGFGLKRGAIATSINHDSHNVIVVGTSGAAMAMAVNALIAVDGGIVVTDGTSRTESLALPIGGLMTPQAPQVVAAALKELKAFARELGCTLEEPFLHLSFLALPVIPSLKITDRGLVDVDQFKLVGLEIDAEPLRD